MLIVLNIFTFLFKYLHFGVLLMNSNIRISEAFKTKMAEKKQRKLLKYESLFILYTTDKRCCFN